MMIDGLQCGYFTRDVFLILKEGGFTCVTSTLGFWEGSQASLDAIGRWRRLARANEDLILIARTADDIARAHESGRIAVLLGFQNSTLFDGRIDYVELFADLGVRVVQLTYNNQNDAGGSCYEEHDNGLARFGREMVREMNRVGILVDLSHVGDKTTFDAIEWSQKPVAISHANAQSLFPHKRNKSDRVLTALAERGGVIGCATYRNITPEAACATVRGWCEMVARTVDIAGIDHVAIGTDEGHSNTQADLDWMRSGNWSRGVDYGAGSAARPGKVPKPDWLPRTSELAKVRDGLIEVGFSEAERHQIMAGNWLRVYRDVFRTDVA
jgi:microsomal dipeptidase-like Zn-dependent dipeptidase